MPIPESVNSGKMSCELYLYWTQRDPLCCAAKLAGYMPATSAYAAPHVHHLHSPRAA